MSFYGNITNTARTQFQFDRIYSNRLEMENSKNNDGIYAGRFVLVEYDTNMHLDTFIRAKKQIENDQEVFYAQPTGDVSYASKLTKSNINLDDIIYISTIETTPAEGYHMKDCKFYKCTSMQSAGSTEPATFIELVNGTTEIPYTVNYNIDYNEYGRGYDSTVWQKVYVNGLEKYQMVAELNTVVPTFELHPDAPTQAPMVPHFDTESSDIYYKLHYQPSWGMRVKSANMEHGPEFDKNGNVIRNTDVSYTASYPDAPLKSDETVIWQRDEYDETTGLSRTLYWHPLSRTWETTKPQGDENSVQGAIYFNRAGFSPETISIDTSRDFISIEPTGISGHQYNQHNGNTGELSSQPDIQEISVMLPSIGSSIAEMWNVVYGNAIQNGGGNERNMDIDWDSTEGLRMVNRRTGEFDHGFSYEPDKVSTLAGAINSVHDLMGMIIESPNQNMDKNFAATAKDDKIYYHDGDYYRRVIEYEYDDANKIVGPKTLSKTEMDALTYQTVKDRFIDFPANKYYYGNTAGYTLETNDYPTIGRDYYTTKKENEPFFSEISFQIYDKSVYYKYINNGSQPEGYYNNDIEPITGTTYCKITTQRVPNYPYVPNVYYYYNKENKPGALIDKDISGAELLSKILLSTGNYNSDYNYYTINIKDGGNVTFDRVELFGVTKDHYYQDQETLQYIRCRDNEIPILTLEQKLDKNLKFFTITEVENSATTNFYFMNRYYTANKDKTEYKVYSATEPDMKLTYYAKAEITDKPIDLIKKGYYINNTFYYQLDNKKYVIDRNNKPYNNGKDPNRVYYTREKILHVLEDVNDVFGIGCEWNVNVVNIPEGVSITTRKPVANMQKVEGFARTLNTIHGLILQVNKILLTHDAHTRDQYTVQGAINVLNDIIDKFEIIAPGHMVIVDDYGRIHSAPHTGDNWIDLTIDSEVIEPSLTFSHKFTKQNDTTSSSSQNDTGSDGTISLYTPIVDAKGHVVGKNTETVELPHNFKSVSVNDTSIYANSHIASFSLNDGDRWINLAATPGTDTITISHAAAGTTTNTSYNTNDTPLFGGSFNVPTIANDNKGHIVQITNHTVTLPTLSLKNGTGNVLTGLTLDITKQAGTLTMSAANVGTLALGNYSKATSSSTLASTDTVSNALGKLEYRLEAVVSDLSSYKTATDKTINNIETEMGKKALQTTVSGLISRIEALESKVK